MHTCSTAGNNHMVPESAKTQRCRKINEGKSNFKKTTTVNDQKATTAGSTTKSEENKPIGMPLYKK